MGESVQKKPDVLLLYTRSDASVPMITVCAFTGAYEQQGTKQGQARQGRKALSRTRTPKILALRPSKVSTTPGNPGNSLEFEITSANPGNLEFY